MPNIELDIKYFIAELNTNSLSNRSVTWLNHSSFLRLLPSKEILKDFTLIGVDGLFLKNLLFRKVRRTSADLVLPRILESSHSKIFLIGGNKDQLFARGQKISELFPGVEILFNIDGYREDLILVTKERMVSLLPDIVIIGMGAPQQEVIALDLMNVQNPNKIFTIFTCGGWLDQIVIENYYPTWAYPLRLNWLVRLLREPQRLWKRYTLEPWVIFRHHKSLRFLRTLENLR